jgi:integrase
MHSQLAVRKFAGPGAASSIEQVAESARSSTQNEHSGRDGRDLQLRGAVGLINLGTNPMALVRVRGRSRRLVEPRVLNRDEIQALVLALTDPCRTAVIFALSTGCDAVNSLP